MNPGELIAILTAKTNQFEKLPTGKLEIDQQLLMAALARIQHPIAPLLLRVKYAQQTDCMETLDRKFWLKVVDISYEQKWKYPKERRGKEFYRNMARMALAEAIWPHVCIACGGVGFITVKRRRLRGRKRKRVGQVIPCEHCQGKGRKLPTQRQRAKLMDIPFTSWLRHWAGPYREIQIALDRIETIGLGSLTNQLRGRK